MANRDYDSVVKCAKLLIGGLVAIGTGVLALTGSEVGKAEHNREIERDINDLQHEFLGSIRNKEKIDDLKSQREKLIWELLKDKLCK